MILSNITYHRSCGCNGLDTETTRDKAFSSMRSVLVYGKKALAITLPANWVKVRGIRPGDKLEVIVTPDGNLVVRTTHKTAGDKYYEVMIDGGDSFPLVLRSVISAYIAGFNKILVKNKNKKLLNDVKRVMESLVLGLNVLDEGEDNIIFYSVVDLSSIGFWNAFSQEHKVASKMLRLTLYGMRTRNRDILTTVIDMDTVVDKLYLYISRMITSTLTGNTPLSDLEISSPALLPILYLSAKSIERIADHSVIIASNSIDLIDNNKEISNDILGRLEEAIKFYNKVVANLISKSHNKSIDYLLDDSFDIIVENVSEARILDSIRRIIRYSIDLSEAMIQSQMIKKITVGQA